MAASRAVSSGTGGDGQRGTRPTSVGGSPSSRRIRPSAPTTEPVRRAPGLIRAVSGPPLVTGATGFAGSHLVDQLLDEHSHVAAWGHAGGRDLPDGRHDRVAWSSVDLLNLDDVTRTLAEVKPSAIFHCAGIADVHSASRASTAALRINALGTHNLLEAVRRCRPRRPGSGYWLGACLSPVGQRDRRERRHRPLDALRSEQVGAGDGRRRGRRGVKCFSCGRSTTPDRDRAMPL